VLLQHFPDDDGVLVVAANSGRASHPDWYLNLVAGSPVRVEAGGRSWSASAEELPPAEAAAAWVRILHRAPAYARYRRTTARAIPILRLRWAGCGQPE
jgi:deazaflavin-dependent oxidoreductase (nitroreductase family)